MTTQIEGKCNLPDGKYAGEWGGYVVTVSANGTTFKLDTVDGVRGMRIPCTVSVNGGAATVATNQQRRADQ